MSNKLDYDADDEILKCNDHLLKLRNIKKQASVRINKAQSAIEGDRLSDALVNIERHRELNARLSYQLTKLESHLRALNVLGK